MTFRYIRDDTGTVTDRKARCAARGDRMTPGTQYDPEQVTNYMADKTTVRLLLAIAASQNWPLEHMDISSAYLHEMFPQTKPVYIKQHPRFDGTLKHPGKAGILMRNIYGTPQAARIYHNGLSKLLTSHGYKPTQADPCLYYKQSEQGLILVAINMDELRSAASFQTLLDEIHAVLTAKYKIKRLGFPEKYLKRHVKRLHNGAIHISQPTVARTILTKTGMLSSNAKRTPLPPKAAFTYTQEDPLLDQQQSFLFRQTIGDLCYLADSTKPDIHPAVSMLASVMHKLARTHKNHLRWLLRYVRGTEQHGILFKANTPNARPSLRTYSDSDCANDHARCSRTGIVHMFHDAPISWNSARQSVVADSTCEAQYLAATAATQQAHWLCRLLVDAHTPENQPTPLLVDNNATILVAQNSAPTKRRKFIDIRHHLIRNHIQRGPVKIQHIPSEDNIADYFTKPLGPCGIIPLRPGLG